MRFEGSIKSWNDDRGFGFIEPTQGGQEIFVHIKAFRPLRARPQTAQRVTFQVQVNPQGKKRAFNVELIQPSRQTAFKKHREQSAPWGLASLLAIPALLIVLLAGHVIGNPPRWTLWAYPTLSILTFMIYALDKSAAKHGQWRTSENKLHLLALFGGWPGAILAQQLLRHKSSKADFRAVFWCTVVLNMAAFIFLASPYGQSMAR